MQKLKHQNLQITKSILNKFCKKDNSVLTLSIIHTNNKRGTKIEREKEKKGGNKRKVSKKKYLSFCFSKNAICGLKYYKSNHSQELTTKYTPKERKKQLGEMKPPLPLGWYFKAICNI